MSDLSSIAEKVHRGERLSFEDGVALYRSSDLMTLARTANELRERLNGNVAYYNVNRHINYTNVCAIDCQLCQGAYARKPGEAGGYAMRLEEVFKFAKGEYTDSLTEFHIVGGLNPDLPFSYYTDLLVEDHEEAARLGDLHSARVGNGQLPRRRRGNLCRAGEALDCGTQDVGQSLAGSGEGGSQGRHPFECDDALRAY
jgi:2-iminoacetate synthase ThiH